MLGTKTMVNFIEENVESLKIHLITFMLGDVKKINFLDS